MTNLRLTAGDKSFLEERQGKSLNNSPFSQSTKTPKTEPKLKLSKAPNESGGNRAKKTEGKKRERLIVERQDNQGKTTFCVQIRRQFIGKKLSLSETFSTMKLAKAWRDRKLAEIELGRIKPEKVERHDIQLVSDILKKRFRDGKPLKTSGVQVLLFLIAHPLCQIDAPKIDRDWFGSIANALLAREITPQTVACYMIRQSPILREYDVLLRTAPDATLRSSTKAAAPLVHPSNFQWITDCISSHGRNSADRRSKCWTVATYLRRYPRVKRRESPTTNAIVLGSHQCLTCYTAAIRVFR